MKWRKFSCGAITDIDEDKCPRHGPLRYKFWPESRKRFWLKLWERIKNLLKTGSPHINFYCEECSSQEIDLSDEELLLLIETEGKNIYTKNYARIENLIKERSSATTKRGPF